MEKNADRKLMYLGDSSSWILPVEGGDADTGVIHLIMRFMEESEIVHLSHKRSLSFFQLSRDRSKHLTQL